MDKMRSRITSEFKYKLWKIMENYGKFPLEIGRGWSKWPHFGEQVCEKMIFDEQYRIIQKKYGDTLVMETFPLPTTIDVTDSFKIIIIYVKRM